MAVQGEPLHSCLGFPYEIRMAALYPNTWSAVQPAERRKGTAAAECLPFKPGHTLPLTLWPKCGHNPRETERCPLSLAKAVAQLELPLVREGGEAG